MGMTTGRGVHEFLDSVWPYHSSSVFHSVGWFILGGGTIERSCYSPHYVNTERDYERDYQATLPQGRTAADGCKPRHGRDDRKRERSFSGLSPTGRGFFCLVVAQCSVTLEFFRARGSSRCFVPLI